MHFVRLASTSEIAPNSVHAVEYQGSSIAIYAIEGNWYATDNICSHDHAYLSDGFLEAEDCTIECPLHGSRFDIASGRPLSLPAFQPIAVYPVRIEGDAVLIGLP
jgi:3-phenylpropionate/trans-cinnamate dioxygenase ferredoxin subunit